MSTVGTDEMCVRMMLLTSGKRLSTLVLLVLVGISCISTVMLSQAIEQEADSTSYVSLEHIAAELDLM